jgi:small-conductance mechanosensitive channel
MPETHLFADFAPLPAGIAVTQLLLSLCAAVAGVLAGHLAARGARSALQAGRTGWWLWLRELLAVVAGPFVTAVLIIGCRALPSLALWPLQLLDDALYLTLLWLLARLALWLLALAAGRGSWLGRRELAFTWLAWAVGVASFIGLLEVLEDTLDTIDLIPGKGVFSLWSLLKGLVVVALFLAVSSIVSRAIERRVMRIESLAPSTRIGIAKFSYFFLTSLGVLIGINAAGVDLTALTVLTGAIGIGLGFGLQSIASNFVSGFVLLMDKSIKPGDVISFTGVTGTSTENFGWVQELRGRYVVVRDRDGVETLVPNQNLITSPVINWSYSDRKVRLKLPVRISYADDPEQALALLVEAAYCSPRVLRDPEPVSRLMHFSDHGIDLELRFWITDPADGVNNVRSDVNRSIWKHFKEAGITIPVAQYDVRVVQTRGGGA